MKTKSSWKNHIFNFLAVILGVYLAFYINERAKTNQDRAERKVFLKSLANDLSNDIMTYETYQVPENERISQNVDGLMLNLMTEDIEAIQAQLPNILEVENYTPTTSTSTSLKSSGKLSLLNDLELQKKIADFYEVLAIECEAKSEYQADYFTNHILQWFAENVNMTNMQLLPEHNLTLFKNKLLIYQSLLDQKTETYKAIVKASKTLKSELEEVVGEGG
jgi:hypothetical protein